jgi:hypothetical protein
LKRSANQTREQRARLRELVQHNLRAVRAMLLREWFDNFWRYRSVDWAGAFLDEWCVQVMRSRIVQMMKVARMLRRQRPLLLNRFHALGEISAAIVEGFNNKSETDQQKGVRFSLVSVLGNRPVPYTRPATEARSDPQILLKTPKWYDTPWLSPGDVPADGLVDLRTSNNELSVWHVEADESILHAVVAALASNKTKRVDKLDYVLP